MLPLQEQGQPVKAKAEIDAVAAGLALPKDIKITLVKE